ncbi:MAG: hypothetical protein JSV86_09750 [Gemmatimonadota bacterium]|nr:MAG: hypothetical protein JSV86_09750 [Gemmatimonadota bacterium]
MKTQTHDRRYQYPAARDPALPAELEELRYRGYAGGLIVQHRAMAVEPHPAPKILTSVFLVLGLLAGWFAALDWVVVAWAWILDFWRAVFGLNGYVVIIDYPLGFSAPYLAVGAGLPGIWTWIAGAAITLALFAGSFLIPRRFLPVAYLVRVIAFFQAGAQVFFALWPTSFPYGASGYVHGMLIAGVALISLTPVLLGLIYYIFDFTLSRKLGLTLVVMLHLSVFIPLQYMAHALILYHSTLLFLPILFFVFGLPLDILVLIAFYAWGVSWRSQWSVEEKGPEPRVFQEAREPA